MKVEKVNIDESKQAIIFGKKRKHLKELMSKTMTQVYAPLPFKTPNQSEIYITGITNESVATARDNLLKLMNDSHGFITKTVVCAPRKIDYLHLNHQEKLRKIMIDNACTITLPSICSNINTIKVSGTELPFVNRAIRSISRIVCEIYVASLQLQVFEANNTPQNNNSPDPFLKLADNLQSYLGKISGQTNCEFILKGKILDLIGSQISVKKAYELVVELDVIKNLIRDTKFSLELGVEHKEFINGKKNGKINKIIKTCNCRIIFTEPQTQQQQQAEDSLNMTIDIYSPAPARLIQGVSLLEDELPAESSFHIPESFHKRIIGVAGKNIQKIMKKYGVYVKFSNSSEFKQIGGYYENEDNVIARTPAKNSESLQDLKTVICESVNAQELIEEVCEVNLPRGYHRWILSEVSKKSQPATSNENNDVHFIIPDCELAIDQLTIEGPLGTVEKQREMLISTLIPKIHDFNVPCTLQIHKSMSDPEFSNVLFNALLNDFGITLLVFNFNPQNLVTQVESQHTSGKNCDTSTNTKPKHVDDRLSGEIDNLEYPIYLVYPQKTTMQALDQAKQQIFGYFSNRNVNDCL